MKKLILLIFVCFCINQAQADEIKNIANKYKEWILGNENTDYSNIEVQTRYKAILKYIKSADKKYDKFKFDEDSKFDFSTKANQKEARIIFSEILFPLSLGCHLKGDINNKNQHYHKEETKNKILHIFKYLRIKGWKEGLNMQYKNIDTYKETGIIGFGGSMGNNFMGYSISLFLNKEILENENLLSDELKTLNWITNVVGPQYSFPKLWEVNGYNADGIRAMLNNRLCYILSLPEDDKNRHKEAKYFAKLFNKSLQITDGWADLIKSDYMGYHHKNAYLNAYAPNAYHTAAIITYLLDDSSLQIDNKAIENLSQAILTMRIYSNKYDCPRASGGRFPDNLNTLLKNITCFAYMAKIKSPFQEEMKGAFMRLWDTQLNEFDSQYTNNVSCKIMYHGSIGAIQLASQLAQENIKAEGDPQGFWFFPYGGLGIYRQDNWLLSFKGNSKYIWDYESSKTENLYGRFVSAGALRIMAGGNPVSASSSGYKIDGWNWTRLPGATTIDMPYDELKSKRRRNFTPQSFLAGLSIDTDNALVSMKYEAPLSSLYLNKSFFFFDDYVVALGTNIKADGDNYAVQTTLFQVGVDNLETANSVNGKIIKGIKHTVIEDKNTYLTDTENHAYFIPEKMKISIGRDHQIAPSDNGKSQKGGYFVSARLLHGINPDDASYLYYIKINGGSKGAKKLSSEYKSLFTIIQKDEFAHIVRYNKSNTTAYALLQANDHANNKTKDEYKENINDKFHAQTDTPCLLIIQELNKNSISIAIQNPEFGRIDETISYNEINNQWHKASTIQPVVITIKGEWSLTTNNKDVEIINSDEDKTIIKFNCFDAKSIKIELKKK